MKENIIVKEFQFDNPFIQKIDSLSDFCIRDCHNKYFLTFDHIVNMTLFLQISPIMKQLIS